MAVVAVISFAACWVLAGRGGAARVGWLVTAESPGRPSEEAAVIGPPVRTLACIIGGGVVGSVFGWPIVTAAGGIAGAVASVAIGRLEPAAVRRERERVAADLPLALDLLAACTRAGRSVDHALLAVADAMGEPLAGPFRLVAHRLVLGDDAIAGWALVRDRPELARLARTMARAMTSGAPVTETLRRLCDDHRRDRRWLNERRARSVGVRAAGPLAVCFLPAFMVVGVVPMVIGALGTLAI
jgi:Flp pilus assembly protein TadB